MLFLSGSLILYFNDTTRSRFTELTQNLSILTRDKLGEEVITDLNMRLLFWKISILHSWNDHLVLTGVGTGDAQDYLDSLYTHPNYQLYGYVGWDSHNQWVFTFVQLGVIGVAAMALLFGWSFKGAFRRSDLRFMIFLIITFGFSQSESILESNKGIVFFSLLFTLLCVSYNKKQLPPNPTARRATSPAPPIVGIFL
jgi:O-antigen ligase